MANDTPGNPDQGIRVDRWQSGPPGFLPKANRQIEQIEQGLGVPVKAPRQLPRTPHGKITFQAIITGNASLATNRWKYAWSEAEMNGDAWQVKTGGRSGTTTTGYAINMLEANHTGTYAWGMDTTGTDYPAGAAPRPIGGAGTDNTHKYNVPVWMTQVYDVNGNLKYVFEAFGSHDGDCTA